MELVGKDPEELNSPELHGVFRSLLGVVGFTLLTQWQIAVYVVALQRKSQASNAGDLRRLNIVAKRLQADPQRLNYRAMTCARFLLMHSDGSFAKEQGMELSLRSISLGQGQGPMAERHVHDSLEPQPKPRLKASPLHDGISLVRLQDNGSGECRF